MRNHPFGDFGKWLWAAHISQPAQILSGETSIIYIDDRKYERLYKTGLVRFMGNGDLWGFIITHKSEWGFMGIYGYE